QEPCDLAYKVRHDDKHTPHDPIVPRETTAPREAGMGTATLVVASEARELVERPRRPTPSTAPPAPAAAAPLDQRAGHTARPRSFAEDWGAPATGRPPTTVASPVT